MSARKKPPDTAINDRVKEVRQALNLSQVQFCKGILLTSGHFAGIELGNRTVNDRLIKLIGTIYGVSEKYLKTGQGKMFDRTPPDPKLEQLISIFNDLPPKYQDYILQQIKQLKKLHEDK